MLAGVGVKPSHTTQNCFTEAFIGNISLISIGDTFHKLKFVSKFLLKSSPPMITDGVGWFNIKVFKTNIVRLRK